jgi:hypothetical protein
VPVSLLQMPPRDALEAEVALPNSLFPSDHGLLLSHSPLHLLALTRTHSHSCTHSRSLLSLFFCVPECISSSLFYFSSLPLHHFNLRICTYAYMCVCVRARANTHTHTHTHSAVSVRVRRKTCPSAIVIDYTCPSVVMIYYTCLSVVVIDYTCLSVIAID